MRLASLITNRAAYTFMVLGIIILIVTGVNAYGGTDPQTMGHSAKELNLEDGVEGTAYFVNKVGIGVASPGARLDILQMSSSEPAVRVNNAQFGGTGINSETISGIAIQGKDDFGLAGDFDGDVRVKEVIKTSSGNVIIQLGAS